MLVAIAIREDIEEGVLDLLDGSVSGAEVYLLHAGGDEQQHRLRATAPD